MRKNMRLVTPSGRNWVARACD